MHHEKGEGFCMRCGEKLPENPCYGEPDFCNPICLEDWEEKSSEWYWNTYGGGRKNAKLDTA